jgi:hypothetical protein
MPYKFNVFSGNLDIVNNDGGSSDDFDTDVNKIVTATVPIVLDNDATSYTNSYMMQFVVVDNEGNVVITE